MLHASYNVAPTQPVATVLAPRPAPEDDGRPDDGAEPAPPRLRAMRWGLVPSWAKDPKIGNRMINARVETVAEKPSYRSLVASRRCLLPADGWFEWQTVPADRSPTGKARKQPFLMAPADGGLVGLAGLYSWWRDKDVADADDPAAWLGTVTVLTTDAEPALRAVHDRMPVVLPPEHWAAWVSRDVPAEEALALVGALPRGPLRRGAGPGRGGQRPQRLARPCWSRPPRASSAGVVDPMTGQLFG